MPLRICVSPYRLLFRHPFETAHGLRDGTDALFVRVVEDGAQGVGEIALPPYVKETIAGARSRLRAIAQRRSWTAEELLASLDRQAELADSPPTRAGLHTALTELLAKRHNQSVKEELAINGFEQPVMVMTIGICIPEEALRRLKELPSAAIKMKVGDHLAISRIRTVVNATEANILLDGNQGIGSVDDAGALLEAVPVHRRLGIEQPFSTAHDDWNVALRERTGTVVYADESCQGLDDLERIAGSFDGVNLKLMKCGGLDRARDMAVRADELNLRVMLGCMSESSLGCTAMAHLASAATILDLDGPWLLRNDPWQGMGCSNGALQMPEGIGIGVRAIPDLDYVDL